MSEYIDKSLSKVKIIMEKFAERLDATPLNGKIKVTETSKILAKELDVPWVTVYSLATILLQDYPGMERRRSKNGGTFRVAPKDESC